MHLHEHHVIYSVFVRLSKDVLLSAPLLTIFAIAVSKLVSVSFSSPQRHIACFAAELSWELGRKLKFDPVAERFIDDDEANRRIRRAPREPWTYNV